jgi:hypothetical protein
MATSCYPAKQPVRSNLAVNLDGPGLFVLMVSRGAGAPVTLYR